MSNCSNCYNGCTEIVSDRCIKYTGIDVPVLGIQTGDSLSFVEQALITFLTSTLDGSGIIIDLSTINICEVVNKYLPTCKDLSIVDISKALIEASCDIQAQVNIIVAELAILNADYTIGCLTGVTASSDTHAIVQATINTLCLLKSDFNALLVSLPLTYVKLNQLDALIQAYLDSQGATTKYYNRMIPYAVVEYYGPIASNFDGTGKGIASSAWENIYLCNGLNGTPDKRGVVGVGYTDGSMLGSALPTVTNPTTLGNPNYTLAGTVVGTNSVVLGLTQIPAHTHTATAVVTPNPHSHAVQTYAGTNTTGSHISAPVNSSGSGTLTGDVTLAVGVTNSSVGGGLGHVNYQPGLGCYYIQYRP